MTLAALLRALSAAAGAARRHPVRALLLLVLVLVVLLALAIGHARELAADLRAEKVARAAEVEQAKARAELEAKGVAVAHEATVQGLQARLAAAVAAEQASTGRASVLAAEVKRMRAAAGKTTPVAVITGDSGPLPSGGQPEGGAPEPGGQGASLPDSPGRVCQFYAGDQGRIRPNLLLEETSEGLWVAAGSANAFRFVPGGEDALLFGGAVRWDVTRAAPPPPPPPPPRPGAILGIGGGFGISGRPSIAGLGVTPPVRVPLFGWRARAWTVPEVVFGPEPVPGKDAAPAVDLRVLGGLAVEIGGGR